MRCSNGSEPKRTLVPWRLAAAAALTVPLLMTSKLQAQNQEQPLPSIKGRTSGGELLMNPVWNEAKDPKKHRYTFRAPSPTVGAKAKKLTAYLPKELCIVALTLKLRAHPVGKPVLVTVSGGRTTPTTLVVPEGQNLQFNNHDPFPHKLFDVGKVKNGLIPQAIKGGGSRTWQPPGVGTYEIRDAFFPSVRSWVVVEPRAAAMGFVNIKGEYTINNLKPGNYDIQGYFSGKKVGKALRLTVRDRPALQNITVPLVVATKAKKKKN
jgi:hypothetical protein